MSKRGGDDDSATVWSLFFSHSSVIASCVRLTDQCVNVCSARLVNSCLIDTDVRAPSHAKEK